MAHGQGGAKDIEDLLFRGPEVCFPKTQLQGAKGDRLAVGKTPSCCLLQGGHGLKGFLDWGGEVTFLPPSPQAADEVRFVMSLQLCFCTAPPSLPSARPTGLPSLPPLSSPCWRVTHSALVQQPRLSEQSCFPRCISFPPDLCLSIWVNAFHIWV